MSTYSINRPQFSMCNTWRAIFGFSCIAFASQHLQAADNSHFDPGSLVGGVVEKAMTPVKAAERGAAHWLKIGIDSVAMSAAATKAVTALLRDEIRLNALEITSKDTPDAIALKLLLKKMSATVTVCDDTAICFVGNKRGSEDFLLQAKKFFVTAVATPYTPSEADLLNGKLPSLTVTFTVNFTPMRLCDLSRLREPKWSKWVESTFYLGGLGMGFGNFKHTQDYQYTVKVSQQAKQRNDSMLFTFTTDESAFPLSKAPCGGEARWCLIKGLPVEEQEAAILRYVQAKDPTVTAMRGNQLLELGRSKADSATATEGLALIKQSSERGDPAGLFYYGGYLFDAAESKEDQDYAMSLIRKSGSSMERTFNTDPKPTRAEIARDATPLGNWDGYVRTPDNSERIQVILEADNKGRLAGHMVHLGRKWVGIPLASITYQGSNITFAVPLLSARFTGTFTRPPNKLIDGTWHEAGVSSQLKLTPYATLMDLKGFAFSCDEACSNLFYGDWRVFKSRDWIGQVPLRGSNYQVRISLQGAGSSDFVGILSDDKSKIPDMKIIEGKSDFKYYTFTVPALNARCTLERAPVQPLQGFWESAGKIHPVTFEAAPPAPFRPTHVAPTARIDARYDHAGEALRPGARVIAAPEERVIAMTGTIFQGRKTSSASLSLRLAGEQVSGFQLARNSAGKQGKLSIVGTLKDGVLTAKTYLNGEYWSDWDAKLDREMTSLKGNFTPVSKRLDQTPGNFKFSK